MARREITVVTDNYPGLVDRLRRGEIDFALSLYMAATMDLELRYEELFLVRTGAFARRGHPLTELPNVCPAQLAEHQWALISGASALSAFVSYFTQRALVPPTVSLQCASVALLSSVVAQSDLLTLLPESLIRSQNLPLKMLAIDGPVRQGRSGGLIHRQSAVETPISRAIVKAISIAAKDLFAAPRSDEVSGGANASAASSAGHADFA
ncbi:MAG: LysR family transcriptional regulator substrate-binding protein [Alphaproteobacteria bacterium]